MTPNEVDIILHAIQQVEGSVNRVADEVKEFRAYADETYVRKDSLQATADARELLWKKRDRLLSRIAVLISAISVVAVVIIGTIHH